MRQKLRDLYGERSNKHYLAGWTKQLAMEGKFLILVFLLINFHCEGQIDAVSIRQAAMEYSQIALEDFRQFLSIPNDAHNPSELEPNMTYLEERFGRLGFLTERLGTRGVDLLLASKVDKLSSKTVLIYLQIDGQPVDPTKWDQEGGPYNPTMKHLAADGQWVPISWKPTPGPDLRIFARSASDAKGPVSAFIAALEIAVQRNWMPGYNIKVIMDGEEELGSPHLPEAVLKHREKLAADMLIIFDGPRHISNRPTLTFGARGITTMRLTTYGPRVPQHSGHYGNYAPNPALHLSQLLASMKDDAGRVTIPGFYDGVELSEEIRKLLRAVPDDETEINNSIGIARADSVAETYQEAIQYPSLNIRGLASAWVGTKVRTIIPSAAVANLDIRTVKESDPERLVGLIRNHILEQGFHICDSFPSENERLTFPKLLSMHYDVSYGAYRTDFDEEVSVWLDSALSRLFGASPIKIRTSGGSIPIAPFVQTLGIPAVTVPIVNRDNNQHSPNENIRVGNFEEGIMTYLAILTQPLD